VIKIYLFQMTPLGS